MQTKQERWLQEQGIHHTQPVYWQLSPAALVEAAIQNQEGMLSDQGALLCNTGLFKGRSPRDKFIVQDAITQDTVYWGNNNSPFLPDQFDALYQKVLQFLQTKTLYIRDAYAGANAMYRLPLRVINTVAWHNLFCHHLFLRPTDLEDIDSPFIIINVPDFQANPVVDGTRSANFTIINFTRRILLIGGTGYAGEMKKGIFMVLNYLLPEVHQVLPMHCAANKGKDGGTALFFGLSGTGKTTLSADANRQLIGDDEHGWDDYGIFNLEGGCYAKTLGLTAQTEPQLWQAIQFGTIVENMSFVPNTRTIDFMNASLTENMRSAYPIEYIPDAARPSVGGIPQHIFILTCDAYGVLPPIAKLNKEQAVYYFLAGYTAQVAETEIGVTHPTAVFSACFGAAFLPLPPVRYAELFQQKLMQYPITVWLVNTGWAGGAVGVGQRIALAYTRALLAAAGSGALDQCPYRQDPIFGFLIPTACPNVAATLLNPSAAWSDQTAYEQQARQLAQAFEENSSTSTVNKAFLTGGPVYRR